MRGGVQPGPPLPATVAAALSNDGSGGGGGGGGGGSEAVPDGGLVSHREAVLPTAIL